MATARRKYMATKDIVRYMLELLSSLDHLHSLDIVHCDVTPSNIFLRRRRDKEDVLRQEAVAAHHAAAEKGRGGGGGARERELAPVYYTCALGDFGHSYIVDQHEQSRSSVAQLGLGVEFVAPEVKEGGGRCVWCCVFSKHTPSFRNWKKTAKGFIRVRVRARFFSLLSRLSLTLALAFSRAVPAGCTNKYNVHYYNVCVRAKLVTKICSEYRLLQPCTHCRVCACVWQYERVRRVECGQDP